MRIGLMSSLFLFVVCLGLAGQAQEPPAGPPGESRLDPLVELLLEIPEPDVQKDVLKGMAQAVKGQRNLPAPAKWAEASKRLAQSADAEIRQLAQSLSLTFGDQQAIEALRKIIQDPSAPLKERQSAVAALAQARDEKLLPLLRELINQPELREPAIQAFAAFDDPNTPGLLLEHFARFNPAEQQAALFTLVSRPRYAEELLAAIEEGQIPARDLPTYLVRQIAAYENAKLNETLRRVWGDVRPASADKARLIQAFKSKLTEEALKKSDLPQGRLVYAKTCAACHVLFDEGRAVGPNLTGSQRNNLDYVLENVFDPSAVVGRDFRLTTIATADGRVLTGIITEEAAESLTLKTPTDDVLLAKSEIEDRKQSVVSMMPEGLFEKLTDAEIRNLIAYLASPAQVRLPDAGERKEGENERGGDGEKEIVPQDGKLKADR
jgi:putative heme-binding domain-containing protein